MLNKFLILLSVCVGELTNAQIPILKYFVPTETFISEYSPIPSEKELLKFNFKGIKTCTAMVRKDTEKPYWSKKKAVVFQFNPKGKLESFCLYNHACSNSIYNCFLYTYGSADELLTKRQTQKLCPNPPEPDTSVIDLGIEPPLPPFSLDTISLAKYHYTYNKDSSKIALSSEQFYSGRRELILEDTYVYNTENSNITFSRQKHSPEYPSTLRLEVNYNELDQVTSIFQLNYIAGLASDTTTKLYDYTIKDQLKKITTRFPNNDSIICQLSYNPEFILEDYSYDDLVKIDAYYRSTQISIDYTIFKNQKPRCIQYATDDFILKKIFTKNGLLKKAFYEGIRTKYTQKEVFRYNKNGLPTQKKFYFKSTEKKRSYVVDYQYEK